MTGEPLCFEVMARANIFRAHCMRNEHRFFATRKTRVYLWSLPRDKFLSCHVKATFTFYKGAFSSFLDRIFESSRFEMKFNLHCREIFIRLIIIMIKRNKRKIKVFPKVQIQIFLHLVKICLTQTLLI